MSRTRALEEGWENVLIAHFATCILVHSLNEHSHRLEIDIQMIRCFSHYLMLWDLFSLDPRYAYLHTLVNRMHEICSNLTKLGFKSGKWQKRYVMEQFFCFHPIYSILPLPISCVFLSRSSVATHCDAPLFLGMACRRACHWMELLGGLNFDVKSSAIQNCFTFQQRAQLRSEVSTTFIPLL